MRTFPQELSAGSSCPILGIERGDGGLSIAGRNGTRREHPHRDALKGRPPGAFVSCGTPIQ
jgi:hypothetical protein